MIATLIVLTWVLGTILTHRYLVDWTGVQYDWVRYLSGNYHEGAFIAFRFVVLFIASATLWPLILPLATIWVLAKKAGLSKKRLMNSAVRFYTLDPVERKAMRK